MDVIPKDVTVRTPLISQPHMLVFQNNYVFGSAFIYYNCRYYLSIDLRNTLLHKNLYLT